MIHRLYFLLTKLSKLNDNNNELDITLIAKGENKKQHAYHWQVRLKQGAIPVSVCQERTAFISITGETAPISVLTNKQHLPHRKFGIKQQYIQWILSILAAGNSTQPQALWKEPIPDEGVVQNTVLIERGQRD